MHRPLFAYARTPGTALAVISAGAFAHAKISGINAATGNPVPKAISVS
jgi:hypothetical protein